MFAFVYLEHKGFFILNSHEIHTITIKVFLGTKQLHLCAVISRPQCFSFCLFLWWVEGAGLVLWAGGPPMLFGFYLGEVIQIQPSTEKILENESR